MFWSLLSCFLSTKCHKIFLVVHVSNLQWQKNNYQHLSLNSDCVISSTSNKQLADLPWKVALCRKCPPQAQEAFISNKQSVEWWEILIEISRVIHEEETKANTKKMPHSLTKADKQTHALTSSSLNNQLWNLQDKSHLFPELRSVGAIIFQSAL